MGNCIFGSLGDSDDDHDDNYHINEEEEEMMIKVTTINGGIMEFSPPVMAGSITSEFPGHAIFPSSSPHKDLLFLHENQHLLPGKPYFLLPLNDNKIDHIAHGLVSTSSKKGHHLRAKSVPTMTSNLVSSTPAAAPYRMSLDYHHYNGGKLFKRCYTDMFSSSRFNVINTNCKKKKRKEQNYWKVKLVISREQLAEILAEENRTEKLIESLRTVAKCGGGERSKSGSKIAGFFDQWSLSSSTNSRNGSCSSSKKDGFI